MIRHFTYLRTLMLGLIALLSAGSASAQLPGYASFQAITITNNTASLVLGYQVPVIFNTQALISTGQLQATGADIRFHAACGGGIIFPHYLDTGLNTTATRLWVKVDSLPASSSRTIYLSYNNPTATNASTISIFPGPFSATNQVTGGTSGGVVGSGNQRGFRFSPNTDILITQVGKNEPSGTTRPVTLFNFSTNAIINQTSVAGPAATYTYTNLTNPIWLTSGTQYLLELFQTATDGYYFGTSTQINSNLTYLDMRYCNSCASTTFPTSVLAGYHYGYPDFNFYTRTIITPAPTVVLGGGGGAVAAVTIASNPPGAICNGGSVTFTPTATNGGSAPTYQWYKNGSQVATGPAYTIAAPVNGDQVYVVLSSSSTCVGTTTATSNTITLVVGNTPAQPGTITGNLAPCTGLNQTYSIAAVTGATTYTWTVPTGWTILSGQGTTSITTSVSLNNGNISVTAGNATCGNSAARTAAVTVGSTPNTPGPISGNTVVCGNASQTYSVAAVAGATGYNWVLPAGWVITAGTNTNTITVTPSGTSGNISVSASNSCGTSASSVFAVTAGSTPAAPGPVSGNATVCAGSANTYSVPSTAGLTYAFTVPTGWSFTQSGSSIATVAGSSGNITVTATNGACGTSAATTFPVLVNPVLTPAVTTSNTSTGNTICSGTNLTFTATGTGGGTNPSYQWKLNGNNVGTNGPTYANSQLQNGDVISVVYTSNYPCLTTATATSTPVTITVIPSVTPGISINSTPPTTLCAGTSLTFTTIITGGGSSPTYQWYKNNQPIAVTTPNYTTATLSNGDSISVQITSSSVCATTPSAMSNKVGLTVQPNVVPTISVTANPSGTIAPGTSVTFSAAFTNGGATPDVLWRKNGAPIPFATGPTYTTTDLHDGDMISARLTSYAPCASPVIVTSNGLRVTMTTGITQVSSGGNWDGTVTLYPNPNSGRFTIACEWGAAHRGERVKIEILNTLGQQVFTDELAPATTQWSVPVWLQDNIANGLYQLRLHTETMSTVRSLSIRR